MSGSFFSLTTDAILDALDAEGFATTGHCLTLNSLENRVYDLKLEDGSHIVAKFYRPDRWTYEQIDEEHEFLLELQAEEIPVCAPLRLSSGHTIASRDDIFFAVWPRTGGRMPDEFSDAELMQLGRMIARLHNVGSRKKAANRITMNASTFGRQPLAYLLEKDILPKHLAHAYSDLVEEICDIYDEWAAEVDLIRIHGDAHGGNLLRGDEGWFLLDFDDFVNGPPVQDIWLLAGQMGLEGMRNRATLLEGYRQFRDFDESWLRLVEPLRALRFVHYASWIARRMDDPAFQNAFPHFGTDDYWENELADLKDQIRAIQDGSGTAVSPGMEIREEEAELGNKDFFWDWED
ncbi:MAG: serine/threonine protein kinase [Leptospiraceae bacterium]|nr:serine/threonine protein kinase [Leptospiraceae bacterium]